MSTWPPSTGPSSLARRLLRGVAVVAVAVAFTLGCFLVLPLTQVISQPPPADLVLRAVDTGALPPPPPPPEPEPEPEPEREPEPPKLSEPAPQLDLSQIELALHQGPAGGALGGDFTVQLDRVLAPAGDDVDVLFSLADLDQKPRALYQPAPAVDARARRKAPGTVQVLFVVDQHGRVEDPVVQSSTDSAFEAPALAAVRQWRFEPGKRKGQPVRFRMRVPIVFPRGS